MENNNCELGKRINELIAKKGYTVHSFAELHNLNSSTLSKIISARVDPKYSTIEAICKALGVDMSELTKPTPPEPKKNTVRTYITKKLEFCEDFELYRIAGYIDAIKDKSLQGLL